jgi:predicted GTPase
VQRFATLADLDRHDCTIEEREEYRPYVRQGLVIFAGVDYRAILDAAEAEADLILWDGGNNDFPFIRADLTIVVCDALRAGHGLDYYPGETNFRAADIVVINKTGLARPADVETIKAIKAAINPGAALVTADLEVTVEEPSVVAGKRVLVIEDGPTVTHGGMGYGAGWVAAQRYGAKEMIDPRAFAEGSIGDVYKAHPQLLAVLPAMGYSPDQRRALKATIEASGAELVLNASPADIARLLDLTVPTVQVSYRFVARKGVDLLARARALLPGH